MFLFNILTNTHTYYILRKSYFMRVHNFAFILINPLIGILFLISQPRGDQNVLTENRDSLQQVYEKEINGWHEQRIANLKKPNGWLALIALDWLGEGMNTIDSIGTVTVEDGTLFVEINNGIHAMLKGREFISVRLKLTPIQVVRIKLKLDREHL